MVAVIIFAVSLVLGFLAGYAVAAAKYGEWIR